uniref:Glutamine amidotransferase type-2 domain-containing protein n=1 Tax=Chrysotila carterae TaxID=13221 RepID=A0A7S4B882_CHRCT|mmetsp:Transcript_26269/g.57571  ORF Transcript_26269/g.57571 Transcript_26269/m.57571 type:complete len:491 (+) Transcript_26269:339-1811(+)
MCRWLVYCGTQPILLKDLIFAPQNSLIHQSFNGGFHPGLSGKNNMGLNADGFGVGWYGCSGAAIFRSVSAAWNNRNLRELCGSVESRCVFAHVRAASGSVISEENCHPFRYGPLLFQHNGHIEGFKRIKRRIFAELRDDVYDWVEGTTDSEACFALVLTLIDPAHLKQQFVPAEALRSAMLGAIALLRTFLHEAEITKGYSTFNFALTDGRTVIVTRFCDKAPRIPPPSLYYAFASACELKEHLQQGPAGLLAPGHGATQARRLSASSLPKKMGRDCSQIERCTGGAFICASEPLTTHVERWHLIDENSMICYEAEGESSEPDSTSVCAALRALALSTSPCTISPAATRPRSPCTDKPPGALAAPGRLPSMTTLDDKASPPLAPPTAKPKDDADADTKMDRDTVWHIELPVDCGPDKEIVGAPGSDARVHVTSLQPEHLDLFIRSRDEQVPGWRKRYLLSALAAGNGIGPPDMSKPDYAARGFATNGHRG